MKDATLHLDISGKDISFDEDYSDAMSENKGETCLAFKIDDLECGAWVSEHSAGVYGKDSTRKGLSKFWDGAYSFINQKLSKAVRLEQKANVIVEILILYVTLPVVSKPGRSERT